MIIIYYSNRLEYLKDSLITLISNDRLHDPFQSEVVLVEHVAMIEWLHIELAKFFTVSANFIFFLASDFIWNILNRSLWNIFPNSIVTREYMSWILMKILSKVNHNTDLVADWSYIKTYLYDDVNSRKFLQLSDEVSDLFIKYFLYRQNWFSEWEKIDKSCIKSWQIELWFLFLKEINDSKVFCYFRYNIYKYIVNVLEKDDGSLAKILPKRILIYAVSYFSPILLEILNSLGNYIDIHIYCVNPSRFFLMKNLDYHVINNVFQKNFDISNCMVKSRSANIISDLLDEYNQNYSISNFLLSVWGKGFQKNFFSLLCLKNVYEQSNFYKNVLNVSLLHTLQNDILDDSLGTASQIHDADQISNSELKIAKIRLLSSNDRSLSVHVCHSIQREIEILHDNLLSMMSDDSSLLPHDILVMAPSIDCYVSTIESVFGYASSCGRHLPFTIFDSSVSNINLVISIFLKLLNLSKMRCTVEEIFEFLDVECISFHFDINNDECKILKKWILESGVRWSLDDDTFSEHMLNPVVNVQYTWEFGLTRMLLSYAIDSKQGSWNDILSYDPAGNNTESINLVSKLSEFLKKLKFWRNQLSRICVLKEWLSIAEDIICDFFIDDFDFETESNLILLKDSWKKIIELGMRVNYCEPVSIDILHDKLFNKLCTKKIKKRVFSGNIIFCNLSSMRSIPFKVIYLLGMNASIYPQNDIPLSFNFMVKNIHFIDCDTWSSDCYLFLEILLAARKSLNISFIGYSMCNDERYRPSILVYELFEYIASNNFYYLQKDSQDISLLTMEWIYNNLWKWHSRFPFSLENFISENYCQSFFKEWLPNINRDFSNCHQKFSSKLPTISITSVSLDTLLNFYNHPVRAWFQSRLKIYIPNILEIPPDEPFFINIRDKYKIRHSIIHAYLHDKDIDVLYRQIRSSGVLPYGNFGKLFWIQQTQVMIKIAKAIKKYYMPNNSNDVAVCLKFENVQLNGVLFSVQENGLFRWKAGDVSIKDGLLLWLEHLVYCAMGGVGDSYMFGINSYWHFHMLSHIEAKKYLSFLIYGYLNGMDTPLLLFNHSGGRWLQSCFDIKTKNISLDLNKQYKARYKLIEAWEGNQYIYSEYNDPYIKKLIPKLDDNHIECIISAAKNYFLFPMRFNIASELDC